MSAVKRHQTVYATLQAQIASGELHALTIKAYTPKEWKSR
jgi:acid stress-induced BolA-like protein IbaG/YrbA